MKSKYRHTDNLDSTFKIIKEKNSQSVFFEEKKVATLVAPEKIYKKYSDKCFMIASGPSLNKLDMNLTESTPVFYMNGSIIKLNTKRSGDIFYAADDLDFFNNRMNYIIKGINSASLCFFSYEGINAICRYDTNLLKKNNIVLLERVNRQLHLPIKSRFLFGLENLFNSDFIYATCNPFSCKFGRVGFSKNIFNGIFGGRTIMYHSLQVAYHLGFRFFLMAGADLSNNKNTSERFYEKGNKARPSSLNEHYDKHIFPSFKIIQKMTKKRIIDIYNLSTESKLPHSIVKKISCLSHIKKSDTFNRKKITIK